MNKRTGLRAEGQREMTLDEWCAKLPDFHLVNKQLHELKKAVVKSEVQPVVSLATVPKLYKNPSCYTKDGDRICNIFYDDKAGHLAFEIHGEHADVVAQLIIEMQG